MRVTSLMNPRELHFYRVGPRRSEEVAKMGLATPVKISEISEEGEVQGARR